MVGSKKGAMTALSIVAIVIIIIIALAAIFLSGIFVYKSVGPITCTGTSCAPQLFGTNITNDCVAVGQPLYPSTQVLNVSAFVQNSLFAACTFTYNGGAGTLTVVCPTHIGSYSGNTLSFPVTLCSKATTSRSTTSVGTTTTGLPTSTTTVRGGSSSTTAPTTITTTTTSNTTTTTPSTTTTINYTGNGSSSHGFSANVVLPPGYGYYICTAGITNYTIKNFSWTALSFSGWAGVGYQYPPHNICSLNASGPSNISLAGVAVASTHPNIVVVPGNTLNYTLYNSSSFVVLAGANGGHGNVAGLNIPSSCKILYQGTMANSAPFTFTAVCPSQSKGTYTISFSNSSAVLPYAILTAYIFPHSAPPTTTTTTSISTTTTSTTTTTGGYYSCFACYSAPITNYTCPSTCPTRSETGCTPPGFQCIASTTTTSTSTSTTTITTNSCGQVIGCFSSQPPASYCPASCPPTPYGGINGCTAGEGPWQCATATTTTTTTTTSTTTSPTTSTITYDVHFLNNTGDTGGASPSTGDTWEFCTGEAGYGFKSLSWNQYGGATSFTSTGNQSGSAAPCSFTTYNTGAWNGAGVIGSKYITKSNVYKVNANGCSSCTTTNVSWTAPNSNYYVFVLASGGWSSGGTGGELVISGAQCTPLFNNKGVGGFIAAEACTPPIATSDSANVNLPASGEASIAAIVVS